MTADKMETEFPYVKNSASNNYPHPFDLFSYFLIFYFGGIHPYDLYVKNGTTDYQSRAYELPITGELATNHGRTDYQSRVRKLDTTTCRSYG